MPRLLAYQLYDVQQAVMNFATHHLEFSYDTDSGQIAIKQRRGSEPALQDLVDRIVEIAAEARNANSQAR